MIGSACLAAIVLVVLHAGAPYLIKRSTLQSEVAAQLRTTTGLTIEMRHARFDLLPRPRVIMSDVRVSDPAGSLVVDATRIVGDVRLLPLIVGRVELAAASLEQPRVALSLDGPPMNSDTTIGRAVRRVASSVDGSDRRLGAVTFVNGTIEVTRRAQQVAPPLNEVNATLDWRNLDTAATLVGSLRAAGVAIDLSAWIAQPSRLLRGDRSAIVVRVHSAPLDMSANGDLAAGDGAGFKGRVIASAPSLAALAALACPGLDLPAPFADASLDGSTTLRIDRDGVPTLDLQRFEFRADGNRFEGTLAYVGGARPLVSGTLATSQVSLAPFLVHAPSATDAMRHWSTTRLGPVRLDAADLDLRVSATRLRIASTFIDDAALSVMTRGERLEFSLSEGKAYGGAVRARISLGPAAEGLNLRAAATLTDGDLAALSWDGLGRQVATGMLSASANVDASGDSVAALMRNMQGWARSRATSGDIWNLAGASNEGGGPPWFRNARTPFVSLDLGARIADGTATLDEGTMLGPIAATLTGTADLVGRRLDLRANVRAPSASELRLAIGGSFDDVAVGPARDGAAPP